MESMNLPQKRGSLRLNVCPHAEDLKILRVFPRKTLYSLEKLRVWHAISYSISRCSDGQKVIERCLEAANAPEDWNKSAGHWSARVESSQGKMNR